MTKIRKGQAPAPLTRAEFQERFNTRFYDPAYAVEADAIARLEATSPGMRCKRAARHRSRARRGAALPTRATRCRCSGSTRASA